MVLEKKKSIRLNYPFGTYVIRVFVIWYLLMLIFFCNQVLNLYICYHYRYLSLIDINQIDFLNFYLVKVY